MSLIKWLPTYGAALVTCLALDYLWLGVVARDFYQRRLGHLLRADVRWIPGTLFYLLYTAALLAFVVQPAVERQSLGRALAMGAFFGLTAYAAYDLTSLALMKDFPVGAGIVDLAWGATVSAAVSVLAYFVALQTI